MDKETNKKIKDFIAAAARRNPGMITAYLFGSFAKDKEIDDSDIDLALIFDYLKDDERFDMQVELMLLASDYDLRIEPHPISIEDFNSGNPFTAEIQRTGIEMKPPIHNIG